MAISQDLGTSESRHIGAIITPIKSSLNGTTQLRSVPSEDSDMFPLTWPRWTTCAWTPSLTARVSTPKTGVFRTTVASLDKVEQPSQHLPVPHNIRHIKQEQPVPTAQVDGMSFYPKDIDDIRNSEFHNLRGMFSWSLTRKAMMLPLRSHSGGWSSAQGEHAALSHRRDDPFFTT
jgi:hypothetical protein